MCFVISNVVQFATNFCSGSHNLPGSLAWSRAPAMDRDGFDVWGSQPSASGPATHAGFDLNSQAPVSEGFPGLGLYGAFLQSDDDELLPGHVRGSGLPPYRPPYARRLNFGSSSSAAAGREGGNGGVFLGGSSSGAGGGVRQRANSAASAPSRHNQRTSTALSGGDIRQRANSAAAAPSSGSGAPFDNGDEEMEDDVEEFASSGGPTVSQSNRAQWNDANSACLLELCMKTVSRTFNRVPEVPQSVRQAENRFRRSMETVSRTFNRVLTCLLRLAHDIIVPKDPTFSEVHPNLENPAFWPHFNDCIGAIDGTHVNVMVDKSKRVPYLNRHNETSQNVLAVCDFDMRFTFVMSGWPDSAHDMRVFKDAITTHHHKFPHPPPGKYYVVDAGYPNRPGYLSPYRCTRYHVQQWQNGPPPQGMKETFNHAHAKVRNVVERSFGVLKMKFRILLNMPKFPEGKQARIIVACMALHNFIRESRIADREFDACDADDNYNPMPSSSASAWPEDEPLVEDINLNAFRDELAHALFHGV